MNLMIDIETLSTRKNAMILSIGVVLFSEVEIINVLSYYPCLKEQEETDRHISRKTLKWHMEKNAVEFNRLMRMDFRLKSDEILADLPIDNNDLFWANSPDFDISILNDYFGFDAFPYHKCRDFRTIKNTKYFRHEYENMKNDRKSGHHNAVSDAVFQANVVLEWFKFLDRGFMGRTFSEPKTNIQ